jgi:hypothetical protein
MVEMRWRNRAQWPLIVASLPDGKSSGCQPHREKHERRDEKPKKLTVCHGFKYRKTNLALRCTPSNEKPKTGTGEQ